ncbi:MAG: exo-alpha-sialidase [Chthoniobacterales bacterium]|nr:exo-alpha-sialidase [Chthoniobacterales bacterium]
MKPRSQFLLSIVTLALVILGIWQQQAGHVSPHFLIPELSLSKKEAPFYREEILDAEEKCSMVHEASMAELPDGSLMAAWYGGSGELASDVAIYISLQKKGSPSWSTPQAIITREKAAADLACFVKGLGNALIFAETDGSVHLLYVTVSAGKWSGSMLNLTTSHDRGVTWEKSRRLCLSPFFNLSELVKNAPTPLKAGGWAIPAYQEFLGKFPELLWLLPDKEGKLQATKSRIAGGCSFFQPTMTPLNAQQSLVWCRDYQTSGMIAMAQSEDAGRSWSHPRPISLPNHDSGIASLRLQNGWLLLVFNDGTTSHRNILRLALSRDGGGTWKRIFTIAQASQGEFSYPFFLQTRDGNIHLLYTWKRQQIHGIVFNLPKVMEWAGVE